MSKYTPPTYRQTDYHCPHCGVFAHQQWHEVHLSLQGKGFQPVNFEMAQCYRCKGLSVWTSKSIAPPRVLLFPRASSAPPPNPDLPADMLTVYQEAAAILPDSPRASAALMRLLIQQLCTELGCEKKNLSDQIGELVAQGLSEQIQQALDYVRVSGNQAVHPSEIQSEDTPEIAGALFDLVNIITEQLITIPKKTQAAYDKIPQGIRDAIQRRDSK